MADLKHKELKFVLVGDHLGQVKKILQPSNEIFPIDCCTDPTSSNPVVSIQPFGDEFHRVIATRNGSLYKYDCIQDKVTPFERQKAELLNKAIGGPNWKVFLVYDKRISTSSLSANDDLLFDLKRGQIESAKVNKDGSIIASAGLDIPLLVHDIESRKKTFQASPPEKNWLGIQPDCFVSDLEFVGGHRVATCSKSDSVVRIYDIRKANQKPVISINIDKTAFNEHADASRFHSIASNGDQGHTIVVGSNVGQILAIDLRFNVKEQPKKRRMQPKTYKILGGFKGPRGATIKDVKLIESSEPTGGHLVISCCLDRYVRLHNFTHKSRDLLRHSFMTTKPLCCSPVLF